MSTPKTIEFSINDITVAVNYWLNNCILREQVAVRNVSYSTQKNVFTVEIEQPDNSPPEET